MFSLENRDGEIAEILSARLDGKTTGPAKQSGRIEKTIDDLMSRGVQFERYDFFQQDARGIWTAPSGTRVAWFKDPDSNLLSISQH